jgi:hypothetical protein
MKVSEREMAAQLADELERAESRRGFGDTELGECLGESAIFLSVLLGLGGFFYILALIAKMGG